MHSGDHARRRTAVLKNIAVASALVVILASGCATKPDEAGPDMPQIMGDENADSELSASNAEQELQNAAGVDAELEHLKRWVLREQEITGEPLVDDNAVELLVDGPETYDAMFTAIDAARDHINFETYIIESDRVGKRLADALIQKSEQGIRVNFIYDSMGSKNADQDMFERMESAGINLFEFNPISATDPTDAPHRNHRKVLIVDGHTAFTGGLNFQETYAQSSDIEPGPEEGLEKGWRDTHIEIRGPAVAALQRSHLDIWEKFSTDATVLEGDYFPDIRPAGKALVRFVDVAGQDGRASEVHRSYLAALDYAQSSIWLMHAYFIPDSVFLEKLKRAAMRGIDVRVIVPSFTDIDMILHASRSQYQDLLDSGVRIFEYQTAIVHAKTAVVDNVWSTVGSANLDAISESRNEEINAIILDSAFARKMQAQFRSDLENTVEITTESWSKRGVVDRMKQAAGRLFKRLL